MLCRATQDGQVMVQSSEKTRSTGEWNGKQLQYSFLENPMNSMKRLYIFFFPLTNLSSSKVESISCIYLASYLLYCTQYIPQRAFQVAIVVKKLPATSGDIRDVDLIPGLERYLGGRHGNPP